MGDGSVWRWVVVALIAVAAVLPARSIWRFVRSLIVPRDVAAPPLPPLTEAERRRVLLSFAALPLLLLVAFIAAWSPHPVASLPTIVAAVIPAGVSVFAGYRVVRGFRTGIARFTYRGWSGDYERAAQPRRFWLATVANGFGALWTGSIALMMLAGGLDPTTLPPASCFVSGSMSVDRCSVIVHQRELRALSKRLAANPEDSDALERRARLYENDGDITLARADWDRLRTIRDHEGRPLTGT